MLLKKALFLSLTLAVLAAAVPAQAQPVRIAEVLTAEISLTQDNPFTLVVHADRVASRTDAALGDEVFVFRSETPLPQDLSKLSGPARIIVRPDGVLIFPENRPALALRTGAAELALPASGLGGSVLDGYQLSRYTSTSEEYLRQAIERQAEAPALSGVSGTGSDLRLALGTRIAVDGGDCISGGPGAESCEISSPAGECDAECNAGYDACCNDGSCSCVAAN